MNIEIPPLENFPDEKAFYKCIPLEKLKKGEFVCDFHFYSETANNDNAITCQAISHSVEFLEWDLADLLGDQNLYQSILFQLKEKEHENFCHRLRKFTDKFINLILNLSLGLTTADNTPESTKPPTNRITQFGEYIGTINNKSSIKIRKSNTMSKIKSKINSEMKGTTSDRSCEKPFHDRIISQNLKNHKEHEDPFTRFDNLYNFNINNPESITVSNGHKSNFVKTTNFPYFFNLEKNKSTTSNDNSVSNKQLNGYTTQNSKSTKIKS